MDINQTISEIRDYTRKHPELAQATIFSFDVLLPKRPSGSIEVAVFGLNEAEYPGIDDAIRAGSQGILEDTSLHNFRDRQDELEKAARASASTWYKQIRSYLEERVQCVLAEFFSGARSTSRTIFLRVTGLISSARLTCSSAATRIAFFSEITKQDWS